MTRLYVTFDSHYHALVAKRSLGKGFSLAPTPRSISSSCASCVEHELSDDEIVAGVDFEKYVGFAGMEGAYILDENGKVVLYEC